MYGLEQWFSNCVPREILWCAGEHIGILENNQLVLQLGMQTSMLDFECTLSIS